MQTITEAELNSLAVWIADYLIPQWQFVDRNFFTEVKQRITDWCGIHNVKII